MDCERLWYFPSKTVFTDQSLFRLYDRSDGGGRHSFHRPDPPDRSDSGVFVSIYAGLLQNRFRHLYFFQGSFQYLQPADSEPPALAGQFVPLVYLFVGSHCDIYRRWPFAWHCLPTDPAGTDFITADKINPHTRPGHCALYTVCHGGLVCNALDRLAKDEYRKSHLFQFFCRSPFVESVSRLRFLLAGARIVYAGHSRKCFDPYGIPESGHVCHDGSIRSAEHSGILFLLSHV